MKSVWEILDRIDERQIKIEGVIQVMENIEDSMIYGKGDVDSYPMAINLLTDVLRDYKKDIDKLIAKGHEIDK